MGCQFKSFDKPVMLCVLPKVTLLLTVSNFAFYNLSLFTFWLKVWETRAQQTNGLVIQA